MFCKVCKDAGKTETEYTSHFVKDKTGKINCPTLLNQACRYCRQTGHTVKFCETLKLNEKKKRREEYFKKQQSERLKKDVKKKVTSFAAAFDSETEDETEDENEDKLDLNEKVPIATHYIRSYASVLVDDSVSQVENVKSSSKPCVISTGYPKGKSWADDSDTDSDEE